MKPRVSNGAVASWSAPVLWRSDRCHQRSRGLPHSKTWRQFVCASLLLPLFFTGCVTARHQNPIVKSEFIFNTAPFPSCHASTIAETKSGLIAAWFGGGDEGKPDVTIWTARHDGQTWSAPVEVATGVQADGKRFPCWNPVLFQAEKELLLFYKVGPKPSNWWGKIIRSADAGKSWSKPERLPENVAGPDRKSVV